MSLFGWAQNLNILANILDRCVNNYMELACINHNSVYEDPEKPGELYRHSKIIAKTEFLELIRN